MRLVRIKASKLIHPMVIFSCLILAFIFVTGSVIAASTLSAEAGGLKNYLATATPKSSLVFEAFPARQLEFAWRWVITVGAVLLLAAIWYYQKIRARKIHFKELADQNQLIRQQKDEIERINERLQKEIAMRMETNDTINYFATSLFGKNTIHEILWDVAKNCISRLGLVDCVIYLLDEERGVLVQKAAYSQKNAEEFKIYVPIEIPLGMGIVGSVAQTGVPEIVQDASVDARYIVDDQARLSELAVPLIAKNKVIGVIDSEHPDKNFFTRYHQDALNTIASICASKISQAHADEKAGKAREAQLKRNKSNSWTK
jgi:putative methionine-R-sulfoxide reductase with GAF domain